MDGFDERLFRACYGGPTPGSVALVVMVVATVVGSGWTLLALLPLLLRRTTRRLGFTLGATLLVCAVVVFVLKTLVERTRPCSRLADVHALFFHAPRDYSFPSGHAAGSFCVAAFFGAVCVRRARESFGSGDRGMGTRWLGAAALLLSIAALIAFSRVYLGVHFPGDVAGGALIGATVGLAGARAWRSGPDAGVDPDIG